MGEPNLQEGISIELLALDLQLLITASLDPKDLLALGCSCRALVETARAEPLWRWHIEETLAEHPGLTVKRSRRKCAPPPPMRCALRRSMLLSVACARIVALRVYVQRSSHRPRARNAHNRRSAHARRACAPARLATAAAQLCASGGECSPQLSDSSTDAACGAWPLAASQPHGAGALHVVAVQERTARDHPRWSAGCASATMPAGGGCAQRARGRPPHGGHVHYEHIFGPLY